MEEVTVIQIVDDFAKRGTSAKTGKDWSMSRVGLSNGESAFIFNPVQIGDVVEAKEANGYKNWVKVNPKVQAEKAQHDEVMKYLKAIYALLGGSEALKAQSPTSTPRTAQTASNEPTEPKEHDYPNRAVQSFEKMQANRQKPDTIAPMSPNDEVDLSQIPF